MRRSVQRLDPAGDRSPPAEGSPPAGGSPPSGVSPPGGPFLRPAVFLDRDGTIIEEVKYLADPDGVILIPGAVEALDLLLDAGFALVVVTNQSGIARGLYGLTDYEAVARRLDELLAAHGIRLDATRFCPHHPSVSGDCTCRKPATGMHREVAEELGLDPARSFFVGDRVGDLLPALELGGEGILVRTGYGADEESTLPAAFRAADDLLEAVRLILGPDLASPATAGSPRVY
jgi:D-glycero-D-manno-heptose 1,7-bisphosphate phosphatase